MKQEKDTLLDERPKGRDGTGMLPALELCRNILHSSMQGVLNTEILQSLQSRVEMQQQQKQGAQVQHMVNDQGLEDCGAPSEESPFMPKCLKPDSQGLACSRELSQGWLAYSDSTKASGPRQMSQAGSQMLYSDRAMESSVATDTLKPSICHSPGLQKIAGFKFGDMGSQVRVQKILEHFSLVYFVSSPLTSHSLGAQSHLTMRLNGIDKSLETGLWDSHLRNCDHVTDASVFYW